MKPGKRNRKGLDMYQTREKIQSIILLLADLICFAVSYFGGRLSVAGGLSKCIRRKYEDRADGDFGIVMVVYMLVMLFRILIIVLLTEVYFRSCGQQSKRALC